MRLLALPENVILVVRFLLRYAFALFPYFISINCLGQTQRLLFHTIGVDEGLSHNSVYNIFQDSRGFIWAASADGLNRYDGRSIETYRPPDAAQNAEAAYIRDRLVEDREGNIWYFCYTGLYCWEKKTEQIKRVKAFNLRSRNLYYLDQEGNLWFHDLNLGIGAYNIYSKSEYIYSYPFVFDARQYRNLQLTANNKGDLWFSIYENGEYYHFDCRKKRYRKLQHTTGITFIKHQDGQLWLSDGKRVTVYKADDMKLLSEFCWADEQLNDPKLLRSKDGRLWISSYGKGLYNIDSRGNILHVYEQSSGKYGPASNNIKTLLEDRSGNIWIGTDAGGMARASLRERLLGKFPEEGINYSQISDFLVWSIFEDKAGKVWFGTDKGLAIYDPQTGQAKAVNVPGIGAGVHISHISEPYKDEMWLCYAGGAGYLKNGSFKKVGLGANDQLMVYKSEPSGKQKLLLATSEGLKVLVRKKGVWEEQIMSGPQQVKMKVTDITRIDDNDCWLSCPNNGLYALHDDGASFGLTDSFTKIKGLRAVHVDEQNRSVLWLASRTGLWKLDMRTRRAELLYTAHGLANSNVYAVLEDRQHKLWLSTNGGLSSLDKQQLLFNNYTYKNGLQSNEFNSGAYHNGASGKLYFGGLKGFNWIRETGTQDTARPQLIVNAVVAGDSALNPFTLQPGGIEMPYNKSSFQLRYAIADYTNPEANYLRYKLEGWDKSWNNSNTGEIQYARLLPGSYTLRLVPVGANMLEGNESILKLEVVAPFWQRSWFRALLLLTVPGFVVSVLYLRHRRKLGTTLRELEQQKMLAAERVRISRDLHDDIGSAITKISLLTELIPMQQKQPHEVLADVKAISATARQVSQSMGEIVWALHEQHDNLAGLLSYMREQIREFLGPLGIRYNLEFPEEAADIRLTGEQRRNIFLVAKEALNNAVKYAGPSLITVSCRQEGRRIVFSVEDDGKGFDIAMAGTDGNGLNNMQRRMDAIGGNFEVGRKRKGTAIMFSIQV
jgi:signal transduction histidine kinase/ligand-binding sensor domain-containing protein